MIRILIVEDEITIARLIDLNLSACGYECTCEYDGLAAADLLEQMSFDLILLDIMLPDPPDENAGDLPDGARLGQRPR